MEKLKEAELEMEVSIFEPEQGEVLGEGEDEDLKTKTSSETKRQHDFKSYDLYMFAGETCEEGKFVYIVIKEEEDKKNINFILKEEVEKYIKQPSGGLEEVEE